MATFSREKGRDAGRSALQQGCAHCDRIPSHGSQPEWIEMQTARGKTVPFVCSVVHALELAELREEEATRIARCKNVPGRRRQNFFDLRYSRPRQPQPNMNCGAHVITGGTCKYAGTAGDPHWLAPTAIRRWTSHITRRGRSRDNNVAVACKSGCRPAPLTATNLAPPLRATVEPYPAG
jgi:hypothetical protein